ncbi:MAG: DMT family transporter [Candidatus Brocadiae bacterium]|nr:DMT family transporter [Candidatus Brocadiia bacterium]
MTKKISLSVIYAFAIFSMLFWSMSFIFSKIVFKYYGPIATITLRLLISVVLLYFVLYFFYKQYLIFPKGHCKLFLLLSFFEPFLYFLGENFGLKTVDATVTSVSIATIPVFNALVGTYILKESLSRINLLGVSLSFLGILMMLITHDFRFSVSPEGLLWLLLAIFSSVGYGLFMKKMTVVYHPIYIIFLQNLIGFLFFLPLFLAWEFSDVIKTSLTLELVCSMLCLSFFASSLAFVLYTYVIKEIGIGKANVFNNLIPIFTAIASYFLLKESFSYHKILGIALVLFGVYCTQLRCKKGKGEVACVPQPN